MFDLFSRRNGILAWVGSLVLWAIFILFPVSNTVTRGGSLVLAALSVFAILAFWWRLVALRWTVLALCAAITVLWFLPGRELYDRHALRAETARALRRYEGVSYHWGGENRYGVDCSGLVRRGAIEGAFREGVRTRNPLLLRTAAKIWWRDTSARELGLGAKREVRRLYRATAIRGYDDSNLRPGDIAVTAGGIHVMAYLGDHLWIEADPAVGKVIVVDGRTTDNAWFNQPVSIHRWKFLSAHRPASSLIP